MRRIIILLLVLLIWVSMAQAQQVDDPRGPTYIVNTTADGDDGTCDTTHCTLREAVTYSPNFAVVYVPAGTYTLTAGAITRSNPRLSITGDSAATTIIQAAETPGSATNRIFTFTMNGEGITLSNMTLRYGRMADVSDVGGALHISGNGTITLSSIIATGNSAGYRGGAIYIDGNNAGTGLHLNLINSELSQNSAVDSGGGLFVSAAAPNTVISIENSKLLNNSSDEGAAGAALLFNGEGGSVTISNSLIANNTNLNLDVGTSGNGGGVFIDFNVYGSATIHDSIFRANIIENTNSSGGGLYIQDTLGTISVTNTRFEQNRATGGGGMAVSNSQKLFVDRSLFLKNNAATGGGLTSNTFETTILNTRFMDNHADLFAGGLRLGAESYLENVRLTNNSAISPFGGTATGGGLGTDGGTVTVKNLILEGNRADENHDCSSLGGVLVSVGGTFIDAAGNCGITGAPKDVIGNLLLNGGFELAGSKASLPKSWKPAGLSGDSRVCQAKKASTGKCAMQFSGGVGENSSLSQNVNLTTNTFVTGESLTLTAFIRGSAATSGTIEALIVYNDTSLAPSKLRIPMGKTGGYVRKSSTKTLASGDIKRITVRVQHTSLSGLTFVDRVYLTRTQP